MQYISALPELQNGCSLQANYTELPSKCAEAELCIAK